MGAGKETIQDKTDKVTSQAKSLVNQAQAQVPPPVARRVHHLTAAVRQRPVSVTAMVLTVIALVLLCPVLSAEANEDHSMVPGSFLVVGVDEWPVMNQSSDPAPTRKYALSNSEPRKDW